jgi:arylsulfatase A-like enzyme
MGWVNRLARVLPLFLLVGLVGLPQGGPGTPAAAASVAERPNVLIILTDDQRTDTMQVMPRTQGWFGAGGTAFSNAFATTPLCCPSRANVMTGQYAHNNGVDNNYEAEDLDERSTIQRYLQEAGYFTGIVGKYLNAWDLARDPAYFSRWAIQNHGYTDRPYNIDGNQKKVKKYTTDFIRKTAIKLLRWFEREDGRPWYLYLTPFAPHHPYTPAKRHRKAKVGKWAPNPAVLEIDESDKPPVVQSWDITMSEAKTTRRQQLRSLLAVDELVNKVLLEMNRLGEQDTIAVYMSDNGFFWGEHGLIDKRWPYMQSARIPMYLRWPGHVPGGVIDPRPAGTIDVLPTMLAAAGVAPDQEAYPVDGRSLLQPGTRTRMMIEHFVDPLIPDIPDWASIVTPEYQYVEYYEETAGEAVTFREYYDLVADPWQLDNLLEDDDRSDPPPDEIVRLSVRLGRDRRCEGTSGAGACP